MTRKEAKSVIHEIIDSGIISEELEDDLQEVCNTICNDSFEMCSVPDIGPNYCEGCKYQENENVLK